MSENVELWEKPEAGEIYMIAGWRQWADAGSMSSGLPKYIIDQTDARKIGQIKPDDFYLFQVPGTHHLVRPVIKHRDGYPVAVHERRNEFYYTGNEHQGIVIFLGDEPHMDVQAYTEAFLEAAKTLGVKRIICLGGVYGELPYDKERAVHCIYSQPHMKEELEALAVDFSNYQGGASIGSYICHAASKGELEFTALYAFVPTYDFSRLVQIGSPLHIEDDYMAWLGTMRRVKHMLKLVFDVSDLEEKSQQMVVTLDEKVKELDGAVPQLGVTDYMARLSAEFTEVRFEPLDNVWEDELRRLFDDESGDGAAG